MNKPRHQLWKLICVLKTCNIYYLAIPYWNWKEVIKVIKREEFFEICAGTGIPREKLEQLLYSVKRSCIYLSLGKVTFHKLLKIEEKDQWPIFKLNTFGDLKSPIYRNADDKNLVKKFAGTIEREMAIRKRVSSKPGWKDLKHVIEERINLFPSIFVFNESDFNEINKKTEKFAKKIEWLRKNRKNKHIATGIKIGAGVAAGFGITIFIRGKIKKGDDSKKEKKENK
jgi:hypothetical protein